ncbi:cysteine desulfurase [Salmonella enterica subsp. enterica serovar Newport]|nr:cysteine desulfurase [Salmonella enterica]ECO0901681.1 cysteine desulfurase [Salmonella enterica subsp. enterica serovar Newport]
MIYFDNAASSTPFIYEKLPFTANPSVRHQEGDKSRWVMDCFRRMLSENLGGFPSNYIFTSGATESANLIIQGICMHAQKTENSRNEIIINETEHPAVYSTVLAMKKKGFVVHTLSVDSDGIVKKEEVAPLLNERTLMVCIMHVNNETGIIQPVNEIFKKIKDIDCKIITVCDVVQAFTKVDLLPDLSCTDFFFSSGHKIGAMKGTGFFYMNENVIISPVFYGGGQENGLRPGTENVDGIYSMMKAYSFYLENRESIHNQIKLLNKTLEESLKKKGIPYKIHSAGHYKSDFIHSVVFYGINAASLFDFLSINGICVSKGSACSNNSSVKSRVLTVMNIPNNEIDSTLRISFSYHNTAEEVKTLSNTISKFIEAGRA